MKNSNLYRPGLRTSALRFFWQSQMKRKKSEKSHNRIDIIYGQKKDSIPSLNRSWQGRFLVFWGGFFFCLCLSLKAGAYFPWLSDMPKTDEKKVYKMEIQAYTMKFFNEASFRHFIGTGIKLKQPFFDIKASYTYSINEDYHYFRPYELNVNWTGFDGEWIIGRKHKEWDWADLFWNRNLWQPIYADDALRPQWAGLTGIFKDFNYTEGQISFFGSFIFIPDFAPPFENNKGKLISENPWFIHPPSGKISSTNIVPSYQVAEINWEDFLRISLGGRASYKGIYMAYAYKPMNKIKTKFPLVLDLSREPEGSHETGYLVKTLLEPVILQHHLLSGGFVVETSGEQNQLTLKETKKSILTKPRQQQKEKQNTRYRLKTSFSYSHPETHHLENKKWIFFQPQKKWHISAKGEIHVQDPWEETILHIAYTHQFQTEEKNKSDLLKVFPDIEQMFLRGSLFEFSKAISTGIEHNIKLSQTQLVQMKGRFIYHLLKEYFLLSFYGSWTFEENVSIFMSGDLLFSDFPFSIAQTRQDIGVYTNKSRIFGGLSYAF